MNRIHYFCMGTIALLLLTLARPGAVPVAVVEVIDGDTIHVMHDGAKVSIRIWGVNAPERGEFGYEDAKARLRQLVGSGVLRFEDLGRDRYKRIVGRVFTDPGGVDVGEVLACEGWARWMPRYAKHAEVLARCEVQAQDAGRGIWVKSATAPAGGQPR